MNYSEMSDFEINKAVASALLSDWFENGLCVARIDGSTRSIFNPCNSWADAGPIIEEGLISLQFYQGSWMASVSPSQETGFRAACFIEKRNPLRAAMIVFLMMQEGK